MEPGMRKLIQAKVITDTLFATRYFFRQENERSFIVGQHHRIIADTLDKVFSGEITRLIINMPPRYSKTEMAVKTFIAKGLAMNPASRYLHLSYSGALALDNSECAKNLVSSSWYQQLFPYVQLCKDSTAKQKWYTTAGGGVYATSSAGQVTGFGAGMVEKDDAKNIEEFSSSLEQADDNTWGGAIIIDDPLKPDDAMSPVKREKVNQRFESTIRSRANSRKTPIIVIMQRLHKQDLAGYLMELEPGKWHVLTLPALITHEDGTEEALFPLKHTVEELHDLRAANPFVFDTQYQQNPRTATDKRWAFAFSRERHCASTKYLPNAPLYVSFDFNRNPITCSMWQIHHNAFWCIDAIALEDATTRQLCQEIARRYPAAMLVVTGDAAGSAKTTMSQLNNYQDIKAFFRLSSSQMQVGTHNPPLAESYLFVNSIFERYNVIIDSDRCKPLIYDLENVLADENHKPIKDSRQNEAQRADMLDNARYFFHAFYRHVQPDNKMTAK